MTGIYDFTAKSLTGRDIPLSSYRDKVLLIVNTASKCGFTPQYEGLEKLHADYEARGFAVLGFPCNQFLGQEPGNSEQIGKFCRLDYFITFPMFEKIHVNGAEAHPLYEWLKEQAPGILGSKSVKWNFTKFLIDRKGNVESRYTPMTPPENIRPTIERLLGRPA